MVLLELRHSHMLLVLVVAAMVVAAMMVAAMVMRKDIQSGRTSPYGVKLGMCSCFRRQIGGIAPGCPHATSRMAVAAAVAWMAALASAFL